MTRGKARLAGGLAAVTAVVLTGAGVAHAVIGTDEGGNQAYRFAAQVQIGGPAGRGCSGALVAPQWIITAKHCFGADVAAGRPAEQVSVTVGRTDRATTAGSVLGVTRLAPHPDRDVVLARLAEPVWTAPPVRVTATAPAAGEELRLLGFGRTADGWVPDRLHGATSAVGEVGAASFTATPADAERAAVCQGDAGGPAVRDTGGVVELVALHQSSGQQGCLASTSTEVGSVEVRVDDLAEWIATTSRQRCLPTVNGQVYAAGMGAPHADFTGDCGADLAANTIAGELRVWGGSGTMDPASIVFPVGPRVVNVGDPFTTANSPRFVVGDFNGDHKTDFIRQNAAGDLLGWASTGDLSANDLLFPGSPVTVGARWTDASVPRIITGDFNGDGRTDIGANYPDGGLRVWPSTGRFVNSQMFTGEGSLDPDIGLTEANYPRIFTADINGDGRSDLVAQHKDGRLLMFRATGNMAGQNAAFVQTSALIGSSWSTTNIPRILLGDYNGDEFTDISAVYPDGKIRTFLNSGTSAPYTGQGVLQDLKFTVADYPRLMVGDHDRDGRTDILAQHTDGRLLLYRSNGAGPELFPVTPRVAGTGFKSTTFSRVF